MIPLLRLALRNLRRNTRRTILTSGATVFAVFLALIFESMAAGTHKRWIEEIVRLYPGHVEVVARGYWDHRTLDYGFRLGEAEAERLERLAGSGSWAPRVESWALAMPDREGALGRAAWLVGIQPERERLVSRLGQSVGLPRWEGDGGGGPVVLGAVLARSMGVGEGDRIILLTTDYYGAQAADRFRVAGTIETGDSRFDSSLVVLPIDGLRAFLEYGDHVSHVALFAERADAASGLAEAASREFGRRDYRVLAWPEMLPDLAQLIALDDAGNRLTLFILLVVAGFGVLNTALMSVFERVREFGVLRAVGARPRTLFGLVLLESIFVALIGIAIGFAIGVPFVLWLEGIEIPLSGDFAAAIEIWRVEPVILFDLERKNLIGTALIMFSIALVAGLPAAIRASRGHPVDAIRTATL